MKGKRKREKPDAPKNIYNGALRRGVPDKANLLAFWLGRRQWTQSQMAAHPNTGPKESPGFNCTNYQAAWALATVLENMGIDSVRALCGLDLKLLEEQAGIGDICQLVAVKVIKHVGKSDVIRKTNRLTGKVQSYAIFVEEDETKSNRAKGAR